MKKLVVLAGSLALVIAFTILWWNQNLQPVNIADKSQKIFVVTKGEGIRNIAVRLNEQGLIRNPIAFFIYVKQNNLDSKIQAGDFQLSPNMSASTIAQNLVHGVLDIWVTIPEGKRAEEIAAIFKDKLPTYDPTWDAVLKSHEGHLFPDTYLIPRSSDISSIIQMLENNFTSHTTSSQSAGSNITIASLIEREAKDPQDRPLISSVIHNRLNINMALQIDSAIQYALGYQPDSQTWWKKSLSTDDLKINSPYNTYINTSLPPGPICNPGQASLQAAASPANTDYIYYFADKSGHTHFARTLDEQNANIQKYGL